MLTRGIMMKTTDGLTESNRIERPVAKKPLQIGADMSLDNPAYARFFHAVENVAFPGDRVTNLSVY